LLHELCDSDEAAYIVSAFCIIDQLVPKSAHNDHQV